MTEIANGFTAQDYREAFEAYDYPVVLNFVALSKEELPEVVLENLAPDYVDDLVAFYFLRYVEEYDESVSVWIPAKKSEMREKPEVLAPTPFAKEMMPMLIQSCERAIEHRRLSQTNEEIDREDDVDDGSARNSG